MKFCTQCGTQLADDALFCMTCGAKQQAAEPSTQPTAAATKKGRKKGKRIVAVLCAVVLVLGIGAGVFFALGGTGNSDNSGDANNSGNSDSSGNIGNNDGQSNVVIKQTVYLPESYKYYIEDKQGNEYLTEKYYTYDAQGRMTSYTEKETYPDEETLAEPYNTVETVTFTYDHYGNLESERRHHVYTYHNGEVREGTSLYTYTYTYDTEGRVVRCATAWVSSDGETTTDEDYTFTYDARGNLVLATSQTDDHTWQYYEYDAKNRLVKETSFGFSVWADVPHQYNQAIYTYDAMGNVTEVKHLIARSYEEVGPAGLEDLEFQESEYSAGHTFYYDKQGRLTGTDEPDTYAYDANGHLVLEEKYGVILERGKEVERLIARYTRDEHGNVTGFESHTYREEFTYVTRELSAEETYSALRTFRIGTSFITNCNPGYNSLINLYPAYHVLYTGNYKDYYHLIPNPIW